MKLKLSLIVILVSAIICANSTEGTTKLGNLQSLYHFFDWEISYTCFHKKIKKQYDFICNSAKLQNNEIIKSLVSFLSHSEISFKISLGPQYQFDCDKKTFEDKKKYPHVKYDALFFKEDNYSLYLHDKQKYKKFSITSDKMCSCLKELINNDQTWNQRASRAFKVSNPVKFFQTFPKNKSFPLFATFGQSDKYLVKIAKYCADK